MQVNEAEHLWAEKFRPHTIDDCILPEVIKDKLKGIIAQGRVGNLLFHSSTPGTGKTTAAKAICDELQCDWLYINSSEDNSIDTFRHRIRNFASKTSLTGGGKVVILDEADGLSNQAQTAFRASLEEYSKNCTFILTCNYPNRLIPALRSRLKEYHFIIPKDERPAMAMQFLKRVCEILDIEKVEYDKKVVAQVIQKFFPDNRKVLNELEGYAVGGKIDVGILSALNGGDVSLLVQHMKDKDFKAIRQWAADAGGYDTASVYENLYKTLYDMVTGSSIPQIVLTLEEYQRHDGIVPSKELHMVALAVALMIDLEWK